ncbi:MAG: cytochrome c biogenesis CcdA family protein, partial [Acidimicrobiia bacterium]
GLLSPVSPCGFAMLPAYLSYFLASGSESDAGEGAGTVMRLARALLVGGVVIAGFGTVYGAAGLIFASGLRAVVTVVPWLALGIGVVLAVLGGLTLSGRWSGFTLPNPLRPGEGRGLRSVFVFGIAYAIATLSCTLAAFLAVVGASLAGPASVGVLYAVYVLGAGAVILALSVSAELAHGGVERVLRRVLPYVSRVAGGLLLIAGLFIVLYWSVVLFRLEGAIRSPIDAVEELQRAASNFMTTNAAAVIAFVVLVVAFGFSIWFRARASRREAQSTPR